MSTYHLISIIAAFLSVSMGTSLILIKSKKNKANIYLGLLLLCYALFFIPGLLDSVGLLNTFPHVIRLNFLSGALVGPFTYLYCKSSIYKQAISIKKNLIHFVFFIIAIVYFLPTLRKSGEQKLEIYITTITEGKVPEPDYIILMLTLSAICYTVFSINMITRYLQHVRNVSSSIDHSFLKWLLFLATSLLFPIVAVLLITVTSVEVISVLASMFSLASFVVIIYITLFIRPAFFDDIPDQIMGNPDGPKLKYKSSKLQESQKVKYQEKLISFIKSKKPFLDPELTISQFAEQLGIPSYYVSQIINERLNMNFLDLINTYRIEEAKRKLSSESLNHYTIVTIAFDSGFNSKTAFYSAFKKHVGTTPSMYRKENQTVFV